MKKTELVEVVKREAARTGLDVRADVTFDWMSNRVPIEDGWSTPPRLLYRLSALHVRLGGDWDRRREKQERPLSFDLVVGESAVIEIDTKRHFSTARKTTLAFYDDIEHSLDLDRYASLCEEYRQQVDRRHQSQQASDFPKSGGRLAQTAYFDFAKDVLTPAHGLRLIRLPAPEGELTEAAFLQLRVLL